MTVDQANMGRKWARDLLDALGVNDGCVRRFTLSFDFDDGYPVLEIERMLTKDELSPELTEAIKDGIAEMPEEVKVWGQEPVRSYSLGESEADFREGERGVYRDRDLTFATYDEMLDYVMRRRREGDGPYVLEESVGDYTQRFTFQTLEEMERAVSGGTDDGDDTSEAVGQISDNGAEGAAGEDDA